MLIFNSFRKKQIIKKITSFYNYHKEHEHMRHQLTCFIAAKTETGWNWPVEVWIECPKATWPIRDWGFESESWRIGNSIVGSSERGWWILQSNTGEKHGSDFIAATSNGSLQLKDHNSLHLNLEHSLKFDPQILPIHLCTFFMFAFPFYIRFQPWK